MVDKQIVISVYAIIVAFVMPMLLAMLGKRLGGFTLEDNKNPRAFFAKTSGMAARAQAAHANSFEILPYFIGSIAFAALFSVPAMTVNTVAWLFIVLRVVFAVLYLLDKHILRSVVWTLSAACPTYLYILCVVYGN